MGEKTNAYFEQATINDAKIVFDLRNDPISRLNSFNMEPLRWDDHVVWFNSHYSEHYLFKQVDRVVGMCRISTSHKIGTLSWIISPEYRQQGYGKFMLSSFVKFVKFNVPDVAMLRAEVKPSNISSAKIAKYAGLIKINESPDKIEFEY